MKHRKPQGVNVTKTVTLLARDHVDIVPHLLLTVFICFTLRSGLKFCNFHVLLQLKAAVQAAAVHTAWDTALVDAQCKSSLLSSRWWYQHDTLTSQSLKRYVVSSPSHEQQWGTRFWKTLSNYVSCCVLTCLNTAEINRPAGVSYGLIFPLLLHWTFVWDCRSGRWHLGYKTLHHVM